MRRAAAVAATLALAGCTHAPTFEPERGTEASVAVPRLEPPARVELVVSQGTDVRLARELALAFARDPSIAAVVTGAGGDYRVRIRVERVADASLSSFLVCFPGFFVFAPAWHGLEWPYEVLSDVELEHPRGTRVARYGTGAMWVAHYTPLRHGALAALGWLSPPYPVAALQAGALAAIEPADTKVLDEAFAEQLGRQWAEGVIGTVVEAIAREREPRAP